MREVGAEPDGAKQAAKLTRWPVGVRAFLEAELDRPLDNAPLVAALKKYRLLGELASSLVYTRVSDRAQEIALTQIVRTATAVRDVVDDARVLDQTVLNFYRYDQERRAGILQLLGVPAEQMTAAFNTLSDQGKALQIHLGHPVNGIDKQKLVDWGLARAKEIEGCADKLRTSKVEVIRVKGAFGDAIRKIVYQEFGFALDPAAYPHRAQVQGGGHRRRSGLDLFVAVRRSQSG